MVVKRGPSGSFSWAGSATWRANPHHPIRKSTTEERRAKSWSEDLFGTELLSLSIYYKGWNNWNSFSPRLNSPYPSRRPHLSGKNVWQKGGDIDFVNVFHQNPITFYTSNFLYPPHVPTYYFSLAHTYFPLHIHWPIIHVIFFLLEG